MKKSVLFLAVALCPWVAGSLAAQSQGEPAPQENTGITEEGEPGKIDRNDDSAVSSASPGPSAAPAAAPDNDSEKKASGQVVIISKSFSNTNNNSADVNLGGATFGIAVSSRSPASEAVPSAPPADATAEKGAGELNVIYQSFYSRINNITISNVDGAAVSFLRFYPKQGLLSLRFEPLVDRGGFAPGENYAQWKGLPWKGRHWDFALGDFHVSTALQQTPFTNVIQPDFFFRGGSVTMRTGGWRYSFYSGLETLSQGQRVPFRSRVPQNGLGAEATDKPLGWLKMGFRYLHLFSSEKDILGQKTFFPLNRQFTRSDSLTTQADVKLLRDLEWYTEAGWNSGETLSPSGPRSSALSLVTGPSWKTPHVVIDANYVRQGIGYLPVLGYYLGDRQGPNADAILRLGWIDFSGSWSQLRNNLERDPAVPSFFSRQESGGINVRLPFSFGLGASYSKIALETSSADQPDQLNDSRQLNATLSRPLFRHNLRATFQQLDIQLQDSAQRIRFLELEDNYHWKRFTVGGAARWQHFASGQRRDSLFFRGSLQAQFPHFSVYSYVEQGKDLANSTLFATNVISTSVVGFAWEAPHKISVQMEAFRNNLNSSLNPASIFILAGQGIPIDTTLSRSDNWSIFLRVSRQLGWGERLSVDARGEVLRQAPVTGTLGGIVRLKTMAGNLGAADVSVIVDSGRKAISDANGYFEMPEVPEGMHLVDLDLDHLPADFNPSGPVQLSVLVKPVQTARVEFSVIPLQAFTGLISDVNGNPAPEGVVIRLLPTDQYTTTNKQGQFGFYDLPEGDYDVLLDAKSLPEDARPTTPTQVPVGVRYGVITPLAIEFVYEIVRAEPKPVRTVPLSELKVM